MVWFAVNRFGYLQFVPMAIVGALIPWLNIKEVAQAEEPTR